MSYLGNGGLIYLIWLNIIMKIKESDLATHFINSFLTDQEVYKEVPAYGIIDIVAVKGNIITSFEAKTSFSFDVIEQAVRNKQRAHYSYVLIPYTKSHSYAHQICRDNGIGIIQVVCMGDGKMRRPEQILAPCLNRKIYKPKLEEWQKLNTAGVQSGRITAFSNTVTEITNHLKRRVDKRDLTKNVLLIIKHHYGSLTSANSSLMNMVNRGVIKDFYFEKGYMILTD